MIKMTPGQPGRNVQCHPQAGQAEIFPRNLDVLISWVGMHVITAIRYLAYAYDYFI